MGLFGGSKSSSSVSSSSTTNANAQQVGVGGDANAPLAGAGSAQANAAGSIAARGNVRVDTTDARNFGTQVERVGNNSNVTITTSDPTVALGAIMTQHETAAAALGANVAAQRDALAAAQNLGGMSYEFAGSVLERFDRVEANRQQATLESINSARTQAEDANSRSESIVRDALGKLADQRAPDGAATAKTLVVLVVAAVVLGLAWIFRRRAKTN